MALFGIADGSGSLGVSLRLPDFGMTNNETKKINENPSGQIQSFHFPNFPIRKKLNRLHSRFKND